MPIRYCMPCDRPFQDVDDAGCPRHEPVDVHDEDDWLDYLGKATG